MGVGVGAMGALSAKSGFGNGTAGQSNLDLIGTQNGRSPVGPIGGPNTFDLTTTSGSAKYQYSYDTHSGTQTPGSYVLGAYAGAGVHFAFGNGSLAKIKGPFKTINGNFALGLEIGGITYSYSGMCGNLLSALHLWAWD